MAESDFDISIKKAELLIDIDPNAALQLLNLYQNDVTSQAIASQVNYYRIQSEAYGDQSLYSLSKASAKIGLKLAKIMNSPSIFIAELAFTKGFAHESLGDIEGALQLYQNGLDVARSMGNQEFIARGLMNIGAIYYLRKDYKQSLIVLNQALQLANSIEDDALLGDIASELGILYGNLNEAAQANTLFQKSYHHYKQAGKHNYALNSLHNVAINHSNQKRYEEAIEVYKTLESEIQPNTSNEFIFGVYRGFSWALLNKKDADIESAYRYIVLAGKYVKEVEQHFVKLQYLIDKAYILEKLARPDEALINIEQAQELFELKADSIYDTSELNILSLKTKLYYALGQHKQARSIQERYFVKYITYKETRDTSEVDELRLKFESEAAARQKDILKQKQHLQNYQLQQLTQEANNRKVLAALLAICILVLAWFLHRIIKGQKILIMTAKIDHLTGVVNRQHILKIAQLNFGEAKIQRQAFSVCIIDIDSFMTINEQFGHQVGDVVLQNVAKYGQDKIRNKDAFGRLSSGKFIALLPNTKYDKAIDIAREIRKEVENATWEIGAVSSITVSSGVATYEQENYDNFIELLKAADKQLLQTKSAYRKKVF
ncbi:tetratricopeptide repeat-containing diguanylate cyclase [Cognaticolwellia mytili]|uniref:tetratricopeptide repeat-containing diguanylate cyclase n=1 Tax=Cognaticolwellia mytili TaxID=1888913 RepID=UPI00117CF67C|nr:tetratricopeptide repeat-containing diguanylate cyclase [Cognaticolwellia mytili]